MTAAPGRGMARIAALTVSAAVAFLVSLRAAPPAMDQTPAATPPAPITSRPLATAADLARLRAYQTRLASLAPALPARSSLAAVLSGLMSTATARSTALTAPDENRALIAALMFYVNEWRMDRAIAEAATWPRAAWRTPTLRGRHDLAEHFAVSAAIAAFAGAPMADLAGVYKELSDAKGGSGFSFSDLAADRAGTLFGSVATRTPESARRVQAAMASSLAEDDFMPDVSSLPDNLPESEFERRYGGSGGPAYNQMVADIDRRVDALPVYSRD